MTDTPPGVFVEYVYLRLNEGNVTDAFVLAHILRQTDTIESGGHRWLPMPHARLALLCEMPESTVRKSVTRMVKRKILFTSTFGHGGVRTLHIRPLAYELLNRPQQAVEAQTSQEDTSPAATVQNGHLQNGQTSHWGAWANAHNRQMDEPQTSNQGISHSHNNNLHGKNGHGSAPNGHLQTPQVDISAAESVESKINTVLHQKDSQDSTDSMAQTLYQAANQVLVEPMNRDDQGGLAWAIRHYGSHLVALAIKAGGGREERIASVAWFLKVLANWSKEGQVAQDIQKRLSRASPDGNPDYLGGKYAAHISNNWSAEEEAEAAALRREYAAGRAGVNQGI